MWCRSSRYNYVPVCGGRTGTIIYLLEVVGPVQLCAYLEWSGQYNYVYLFEVVVLLQLCTTCIWCGRGSVQLCTCIWCGRGLVQLCTCIWRPGWYNYVPVYGVAVCRYNYVLVYCGRAGTIMYLYMVVRPVQLCTCILWSGRYNYVPVYGGRVRTMCTCTCMWWSGQYNYVPVCSGLVGTIMYLYVVVGSVQLCTCILWSGRYNVYLYLYVVVWPVQLCTCTCIWWSGRYNYVPVPVYGGLAGTIMYLYLYVVVGTIMYLCLYMVVWPVQLCTCTCMWWSGRYNYIPVPVCGGLAGTNSVVLTHSGRTKERIKVNIENIPE